MLIRILKKIKRTLFPYNPKFNSLEERICANAFVRPNYAYGIWRAALEAKQLGYKSISAIEFGVAGGNGLLAMEDVADIIANDTGVRIDLFGFDSGEGMPIARDYRDLPHIWQPGFFSMDSHALKSRLRYAKLILGDVQKTVSEFTGNPDSPIGFISFDLDYYSSTVEAFRIFEKPSTTRLPRVFCYFDDAIGDHWETHCEFLGELLAINEFNAKNQHQKIARINGLAYKFHSRQIWHDLIFVHHDFSNSLYSKFIYPNKNWQLPISS